MLVAYDTVYQSVYWVCSDEIYRTTVTTNTNSLLFVYDGDVYLGYKEVPKYRH